jgi:hypothetical protein
MRANRLLLFRLPLTFALAATAGVAIACGPMNGSGTGGSGQGGSGNGGDHNGAAERMREGASDAAGANQGGDDTEGRRSPSNPGASRGMSSTISAIAAAEFDHAADAVESVQEAQDAKNAAKNAQMAAEAHDAAQNALAIIHATSDDTPEWLAWNDLPWYQRDPNDEPPRHKGIRPFIFANNGIDTPEFKDRDFAAESRQSTALAKQAMAEMNDPAYQQSLRDTQAARTAQLDKQAALQPTTFMGPEGYGKSQAWLEWNSQPWYQRTPWTEPSAKPEDHRIAKPNLSAPGG